MDENPHVPQPTYPCDKILFRAVPYDSLVRKSDGKHKDGVFIRREASDPNGLSVTTSIRACKEQFERPIFGVRTLHVGRLRDYGLELFDRTDAHANIRYPDGDNIPTKDENEPEARNIAADLMEMSRPISYWDDDDADERFLAEYRAKLAAFAEPRQDNP
jgi:hypothetical protein